MRFFVLAGESMVEEYAVPGPEIASLGFACERSEFQFLDREPMSVEISRDGGTEFPDFIISEGRIPLVSERLREALLALGADYLFWKPVNLTFAPMGFNEPYWLALPPRIDCLDRDECDIEEDGSNGPSWEKRHYARRITILENMIGNYRIFKLPFDMLNQEIIVSEDVKNSLERQNFSNLYFYPLEGE